MQYRLELWDQPFNAIRAATKKVEGRVKTPWEKTPLDKLVARDTLIFERESDRKEMEVEVLYVHHYPDTRSMLEAEDPRNVLSYQGTVEEGIESYNEIENYKENIPLHGIYAIGIKPIKDK